MDSEDFINMTNIQAAISRLNSSSKVAKTPEPEPDAPAPVGYDINRPYNDGPNFTILTPGACNAKCGFCFWNHEQGKLKPTLGIYRLKLKHNLTALPPMYRTISISGGEPTLSSYLPSILATISTVSKNTNKFNRVVLTTNGVGLIEKEQDDPWFSMLICTVKHINISRHHFDDTENFNIFKTASVPTTKQLAEIILKVQQANLLFGTSVDVTLNCVIDDSTTEDFCYQFIDFAQTVGAHAVSFRKQASTVDPTPVEKAFIETLGAGEFNNCPVCRGRQQAIDEFPVRWKGSVTEPSLVLGKVYEAIMHANGDVYADWGMKEKLRVYTDDTKTPSKDFNLTHGPLLGKSGASLMSYADDVFPAKKKKACGSTSCGG